MAKYRSSTLGLKASDNIHLTVCRLRCPSALVSLHASGLLSSQVGSAMQNTRLVYASNHTRTSVESLDRILQSSRANNVRDGITGALIIGEKHFLQLLEGDRTAVARCFMRIILDSRHHDISVLCAQDAQERLFSDWSMHRIETSRIKQHILDRYTSHGIFDPSQMSQIEIEDMCRTLSAGNWEKLAA